MNSSRKVFTKDPTHNAEGSDVFTTDPYPQEMPANKIGSQRHTEKFKRLHDLHAQNPSFTSHTPLTSEVILEGQQMASSNFSDVLSGLYQNQSKPNARGQKELLTVLAKIYKASSIRAKTFSKYVSSKELINELNSTSKWERKRGALVLLKPSGYSLKVFKL